MIEKNPIDGIVGFMEFVFILIFFSRRVGPRE
jgi:hypothetical protein